MIYNFIIAKNYNKKSGIIYCTSKKDCERVAEKLTNEYKVKASYYHAGMYDNERNKVQNSWMMDEIQVIK